MHKYNHARSLIVLMVVLFPLILTGCWSSNEIDELGLVVGTAIDLEKERSLGEEVAITITNQLVTSQTASGTGTRKGSSEQKAYKNVSETGDAILPTLRDMALKVDQRLFAQHIKVIVIGEDLARTLNMQKILDFTLREEEIRPSCLLLIAKNNASKTLETEEPGVIPAYHLVQITEGHERSTKVLPPVPLAKLEGKMNSESSFLLQSVETVNREVKMTGAAVIDGKTKRLKGFLDEKELEGLEWLTGKGRGGIVKITDENTGDTIVYEILSMKSKIQPRVNGNNISFMVKIESEGRIAEEWVLSEDSFDNEHLKRVEKTTEKEVERLVKNAIDQAQQEYQVDVFGFGNRLRIEYPRVWEKVKNQWDETFSEVPIEYNVKLTIKDYGTVGH